MRHYGVPPARPGALALAVFATVLVAEPTPGRAHVAPSERDNNRYLKLTLLGDRIRLVYTVYLGEAPGAQARRRMDGDGDGVLAPAEAQRYGDELGRAVAAGLAYEVDGRAVAPRWDRVDVGLGTPAVAAGAFSVDLVAWLPLASPRTRTAHELLLIDGWVPPLPGETEVRIEESPGVRAVRAAHGRDGAGSQLRWAWTGATSPLAERGLYVELVVDPEVAAMALDEPAPGRARRPAWLVVAALAAALLGGGLGLRRWRSRRSNT